MLTLKASKHEINNDENRTRMLFPCDAITAYFSARVLGLHILKRIDFKDAQHFTYKICD